MEISNNSKPKFWVSQAISLPSLIIYLTICLTLLISPLAFAQEGEIEEVIVKGSVLYSDQVNALKTPVEVIDVPQTVSIVPMKILGSKASDKLATLLDTHQV